MHTCEALSRAAQTSGHVGASIRTKHTDKLWEGRVGGRGGFGGVSFSYRSSKAAAAASLALRARLFASSTAASSSLFSARACGERGDILHGVDIFAYISARARGRKGTE